MLALEHSGACQASLAEFLTHAIEGKTRSFYGCNSSIGSHLLFFVVGLVVSSKLLMAVIVLRHFVQCS